MSEIIEDGSGDGYKLKIDSSNRARTFSVTESEEISSIFDGDGYVFNTGYFSVSQDSSLLYFKNNETRDFVTGFFVLSVQDGITFSEYPVVNVYKNPTAGDLITDATAVSINQNTNFGSAKSISANIYKGKDGGTVTGGDLVGVFQANKGGRFASGTTWIVPPGSSIAFEFDSAIGSGSANVSFILTGFLKDGSSL